MQDNSFNLDINKIKHALEAQVFSGEGLLSEAVSDIYASDLMSDVLAHGKSGSCLLTGLNTIQTIISSYMAEFTAVVFIRGKIPSQEMCNFAKQKGIALLSTKVDMYEACIKVANSKGSMASETIKSTDEEEILTLHDYLIDGKDFASAGLVSTNIKSILKDIGYDIALIRQVAISVYEGEMNVVMHAISAKVTLTATNSYIKIIIDDKGKGIPDIEKAMEKGFSTATEEQRAMGFGAGMGLPNIKKNSSDLKITSEVGKGTKLEILFDVK